MTTTRIAALRPPPSSAGSTNQAAERGGSFAQSLERAGTATSPASTAHAQALDLLAAQQASNLQYLALQQKLSNSHDSVISNVLKVRHETAKNAIGNIR